MDATTSTTRAGPGLSFAVAVSLAAALPLWRAILPGNYYVLGESMLSFQSAASLWLFAGAILLLGLLLAVSLMTAARALAEGHGRAAAFFGLAALGGLLLLFQHATAPPRWIASLVSLPVATITWLALARRAAAQTGGAGRYVDGWFAGLLLDLVLRYAANSYDFSWQRNAVAAAMVGMLAVAAWAAAGWCWPRHGETSGAGLALPPVAWLVLPVAACLANVSSQHVGALAADLQRPLAAASMIAAGYLLVGWGLTRGAAPSTVMAEVLGGILLLLLAIVGMDWETFALAAMAPAIAGILVSAAVRPGDGGASARAPLAAFGGLSVVWVAMNLAGAREALYPTGRSLDGIWLTVVALAVARFQGWRPLPPRADRWAYAAVGGALLVALSTLVPAGAGSSTNPGSTVIGADVTAMTFNIHRGVGTADTIDLEGIAAAIRRQPGQHLVVGLQEVNRGRKLEAGIDALGWLANRLDRRFAFGATSSPQYGLALLSHTLPRSWRVVPFSTPNEHHPGILVAAMRAQPPLRVVVARLDDDARAKQARELGEARVDGDTLLLADLAANQGTGAFAAVLQSGEWRDSWALAARPDQRGLTYPADRPEQRRDAVLLHGGLTVRQAQVWPTTASTHRPVAVQCQRAPATPGE
jgi:endonuclease/exonuclease/phosphatase family metal-dependent hydrolase